MKHETEFVMNTNELSWIVALMDLGNVISPLFAGYFMDKLGRKLSTIFLGPLFIISWLLTLYVPTFWALCTARMMAGIGKGISYTVVPVFLGEIAGAKIRGALSSTFCIQLHLGFLLEAVIGPLVKYRTLNTISAVFPVVFVVLAIWIPESPYYLLKKNRRPEATRCLRWYRCEQDEIKLADELRQMVANVENEMKNRSTFREVFASPKDRWSLGVLVAACISQRAGGISCIIAYSALILPEPSPIVPRFEYIMVFAVALVVVTLMCATQVDQVGRKPLLVISEAGMGVITAGFAIYFYAGSPMRLVWLPYALFLSFSVMFSIGVGFIPVVYLGEIFPINIRSHCSSILSITLAFSSFVTNKIFPLVSRTYGIHVMFCLFTVINFAGAAYSYKYAIETKGKTLQEIQQILEGTVKKRQPKT